MAELIDERWEYWTPDPEIAFVMGETKAFGYEGLPWVKNSDSGKKWVPGFRFGRRLLSLNYTRFRLGSPKKGRYERPEIRCQQCGVKFMPKQRVQRFCSISCVAQWQILPPRVCQICGVRYQAKHPLQRFCSLKCARPFLATVHYNRPRHLDWDRIVELYQSGMRISHIAAKLGTNRKSVVIALQRRGVYRGPGPSGPPAVIQPVPCQWCKVVFKPKQRGQDKYCSRKCFQAADRLPPKTCPGCGLSYAPNYRQQQFCSNRCYLRSPANPKKRANHAEILRLAKSGLSAVKISAQLKCSPRTIREVLRNHKLKQVGATDARGDQAGG